MSDAALSSPPVAAQGAGSLLPGATVAIVSSSQTHPAGSCGSAGAFGRVPAYDAVLDFIEAERARQSGIRSLAEILRHAAQEAAAKMTKADRQAAFEKGRAAIAAAAALRKAARREEIIAALMVEPPPSIGHVARTLRAKTTNIAAIAKEIGRYGLWKAQPKPRVPRPPRHKRVKMSPVERRQKRSLCSNVPKQPEVQTVSIPCICCERPFKSWDRKLNRMCGPCKESA